mgnify:CR=1 FL=1
MSTNAPANTYARSGQMPGPDKLRKMTREGRIVSREQKAVAILLTLLALDIRGIRVGPTPPAFITPNVLKVLEDKFNLKLITTPEKDLKDILSPKRLERKAI